MRSLEQIQHRFYTATSLQLSDWTMTWLVHIKATTAPWTWPDIGCSMVSAQAVARSLVLSGSSKCFCGQLFWFCLIFRSFIRWFKTFIIHKIYLKASEWLVDLSDIYVDFDHRNVNGAFVASPAQRGGEQIAVQLGSATFSHRINCEMNFGRWKLYRWSLSVVK